jgi:hypothetical protein
VIPKSGNRFSAKITLKIVGERQCDMKRAELLLALASIALALLAIEVLLNIFANANSRPAFGADTRDWRQAMVDLRAAGIDAYPIVSAQVYGQSLGRSDDSILPLAGLSQTTTTFCNELGQFIVFRSDRYGFRNDDRLWDAKPPFMLVGDSFAQGACVPDDATIPSSLARLGLPTVSVAYNSNGPLAELAALAEYGPLVRPATVIWLYYEGNDPTDLDRELESPVLRQYLTAGFRQDLPNRQAEIDRLLRTALDARPEIQEINAAVASRWEFSGILSLRNIRALIRSAVPKPAGQRAAPELDDAVAIRLTEQRLSDLELVLIRAKEVVGTWRGRLIIVYLPASERYRFPALPDVKTLAQNQAEVIKLAAELQIPVIDLGPALAAAGPRLYPKADWPVHFTADGYRLIADAIAVRLRSGN